MSEFRDELFQLEGQTTEALVEFLQTDLDTCFTFLSLAETEHSIGERATAQKSLGDAQRGYRTVLRFLSAPKYSGRLPELTLQALTARTEKLRESLERTARNIAT